VAKTNRSSVRDDKQYEGLAEHEQVAPRHGSPNDPGSSSKGWKASGSGKRRIAAGQGGTNAQRPRPAGRAARRAAAERASRRAVGRAARPDRRSAPRSTRCAAPRTGAPRRRLHAETGQRPAIVIVAWSSEVEPLLTADADAAHAGEARRRVIPVASPRAIRPRAVFRVDPLLEPAARSDSRRP
jgi:hypothetical protein